MQNKQWHGCFEMKKSENSSVTINNYLGLTNCIAIQRNISLVNFWLRIFIAFYFVLDNVMKKMFSEGVLKMVILKFRKLHRKTPVSESLF